MAVATADPAVEADAGRIVAPLIEPALAELRVRLATVAGLSANEREAIHTGLSGWLRAAVWRWVSRVVVLELHIARRAGALTAADSGARWQEWAQWLSRPGSWPQLARPYPVLLAKVQRAVTNRCTAALRLAGRFAADRARLGELGELGELRAVEFGAGDSHAGGQTTTILRFAAGGVVYKPRSLAVDAALARLLPVLLPDEPAATRIRVPAVLVRRDRYGDYGWAELVAHRYCAGERELASFYRGLGHWLAVLRLLSGSDLHSENLIAAGPVPVVVDCETLFTPASPMLPTGYGAAADDARSRLDQSVLRTGLLPGRGRQLGFRGVDLSGAGALPGQQPELQVPALVDQGTDQVRVGMVEVSPPPGQNLPTPQPDPGSHWEQVVAGFRELTDRLHALDRTGQLAPLLAPFADCPVRVVVRDTASYGVLGRMLWHPSSLHRPDSAVRYASELLARHAGNRADAPTNPAVIAAEVAELADGDIPLFLTTPRSGVRSGPGGTSGQPEDLIAAALARWRRADPAADRRLIRSTLVSAYRADGWHGPAWRPRAPAVPAANLDRERRDLAAAIITQLAGEAIRGSDGTVTWTAPSYGPLGWSVRSLPPDLYSGTAGVAVALAGYAAEVAAGRADPVPELAELLAGTLATLRLADDQQDVDRAEAEADGLALRPELAGGYCGLGSRVWAWLLLRRLGVVEAAEAHRRAAALAGLLAEAVAVDEIYDLLTGAAGALVPLLRLVEHTGQPRWAGLAEQIGDRLATAVRLDRDGARWPNQPFPAGLGGLAHGVTGIGWALHRVAAGPGGDRFRTLADAARQWEETLYRPDRPGWRDLRTADDSTGFVDAWCHGSVGIGLAAADLLGSVPAAPDLVRRAAAAAWRSWNDRRSPYGDSLCHGGFGNWELVQRAAALGLAPAVQPPAAMAAELLADLAARGQVIGVVPAVFHPGLLVGAGGVAYQLLRMHRDCPLPSVLLPDPGGTEDLYPNCPIERGVRE